MVSLMTSKPSHNKEVHMAGGDKKRKGTSRKKKALIYKMTARLDVNRNEQAKVEKRRFIKGMKDIGFAVSLDEFTKCKVCRDEKDRIMTNTVAPLKHLKVDAHGREDVVLYGGYCVRCGKAHAPEVIEKRKLKRIKAQEAK